MKKSIKLLFLVAIASIIKFTSVGSVFADRRMILPGLLQIEYRNRYAASEGGETYSTAKSEASAINIKDYEART